MRNELVKLLLGHQILEVEQKSRALFVRYGRESVVWVLTLEVEDQLREFVVGPVEVDRFDKTVPPDDGVEVAVWFAVDFGENLILLAGCKLIG